ncbi:hypothetical protein K439DRAFT_1308217, partial [Ramaria rubella]
LQNGGVVFELDSESSLKMIRADPTPFESNFSATSIVKERVYTPIVEYVPISHSPDALGEMKRIEGYTGLNEDTLISTRWIKPVERRSKNQRTTHLIARFSDIESANIAIRDGMVIVGRRCGARRLKKEPRRCLKCQEIDSRHLAAKCPNPEHGGTCGNEHRTSECTNHGEEDKTFCVNCKTEEHSSWSRGCPKFIESCQKIESRDSENFYKFFPTDEYWTW